MYGALEHVIIDQVWTTALFKMNYKQADKYFKVGEAAKALGYGLLCNDKLLVPTAPLSKKSLRKQ